MTNPFKKGDEVYLPTYGKSNWDNGYEEDEDWALKDDIPLNTKLTVLESNEDWVRFKEYPKFVHPSKKFRPISELQTTNNRYDLY